MIYSIITRLAIERSLYLLDAALVVYFINYFYKAHNEIIFGVAKLQQIITNYISSACKEKRLNDLITNAVYVYISREDFNSYTFISGSQTLISHLPHHISFISITD